MKKKSQSVKYSRSLTARAIANVALKITKKKGVQCKWLGDSCHLHITSEDVEVLSHTAFTTTLLRMEDLEEKEASYGKYVVLPVPEHAARYA